MLLRYLTEYYWRIEGQLTNRGKADWKRKEYLHLHSPFAPTPYVSRFLLLQYQRVKCNSCNLIVDIWMRENATFACFLVKVETQMAYS
jgi:hypothetical protein